MSPEDHQLLDPLDLEHTRPETYARARLHVLARLHVPMSERSSWLRSHGVRDLSWLPSIALRKRNRGPVGPALHAFLDANLPGWEELRPRFKQLVEDLRAYEAEFGRLPRFTGHNDREGVLGGRLCGARKRSAEGAMCSRDEDLFDDAFGPQWRLSKRDLVALRWEQLFARIVRMYERGEKVPLNKSDVGRWAEKQRALNREGRLRADRAERIEQALPGWLDAPKVADWAPVPQTASAAH